MFFEKKKKICLFIIVNNNNNNKSCQIRVMNGQFNFLKMSKFKNSTSN